MRSKRRMKQHKRRILSDNNGTTLIELVVAIVVLSIIMIMVTAVFAPVIRTFERANNLAEANTLLDNLSALIMNDIGSATAIPLISADSFIVKNVYDVFYYADNGILYRSAHGYANPVLPKDFYKYRGDDTVFRVAAACDLDETSGIVTVTLTLTADFGWNLERTYTARPVGLVR